MTKSTISGKFLILSKDEINDMLANEKEYTYKIIQIEPGFDGDYMVEVMEKGSGVTMVPISDLDSVVKNMCSVTENMCGDKE